MWPLWLNGLITFLVASFGGGIVLICFWAGMRSGINKAIDDFRKENNLDLKRDKHD